jgi:23S rRNA pseudouridine1911/1915/1917 synthase
MYRRLSHNLLILYEDQDIIVVNKPAGLLSIAAGGEREKTAYWILAEYLRKKGEKRRPAVLHRMYRDTSGVMLFVKSALVKRRFMQNWNSMVIERRYIALVEGEMPNIASNAIACNAAEGTIDLPVYGKPAITHWKLLRSGGGFSLLALNLETGRRNQIRVHLAAIGHPVAGDTKFGAQRGRRLCLHAEALEFHHPRDGRIMKFEVKTPFGLKN